MEAGPCPYDQTERRWLAPFTQMQTQTVEEYVVLEDDGYLTLKDRDYPVNYDIAECPQCKRLFLFDVLGGLGEIDRADYERRLAYSRKRFG